MPPVTTLSLSAHDELYIIDLEKVIYMQADDHYTHIYYSRNGRKWFCRDSSYPQTDRQHSSLLAAL